MIEAPSDSELDIVAAQLGRRPRGVRAIAYRTPDGQPAVVTTVPRLPDGTPFPTLYYLTEPRLTVLASRQEASGLMRRMAQWLADDPAVAAAYESAHRSYLAERDAIQTLGTEVSAGGMPQRVKCLHALMAHALAKGPGVNPLGDESVALAAEQGLRGAAIPRDWPSPKHFHENTAWSKGSPDE